MEFKLEELHVDGGEEVVGEGEGLEVDVVHAHHVQGLIGRLGGEGGSGAPGMVFLWSVSSIMQIVNYCKPMYQTLCFMRQKYITSAALKDK